VYIEIHFQSASPDGLRKFIESVACPIDGVSPSFDSFHSPGDQSHILRYITCCREMNGLLKRKISALHAEVRYEEEKDV